MHGIPDRAWGKLLRFAGEVGPVIWHPLVDHCADVSATMEALLRQPVMGSRLCSLGGLKHFDERIIQRLGAIAFLHDIGKANRGFQNKRLLPPGTRSAPGIETAGHVRELWPLFNKDALSSRLQVALPVEALCGWAGEATVSGLLAAAVSHHGTPWSPLKDNPEDRYRFDHLWEPSPEGYDPFAALTELGSALPGWFPAAFEPGGLPLPDGPAFQHAFAGLVMLADWLGSDTDFFRYSEEGDEDRMSFARRQAPAALAAVGIEASEKRAFVSVARPAFTQVFPSIPKANAMQDAAGRLDLGRLVVLEAETGSGKTEAALWRFKGLFEAGEVDGLYFALPTRVAASQIHGRVEKAVRHLFAGDNRPAVVLAVPGYAKVDEVEGRILPNFVGRHEN